LFCELLPNAPNRVCGLGEADRLLRILRDFLWLRYKISGHRALDTQIGANLSPPPQAAPMPTAFRSHGRRKLSHLQRLEAWRSSGVRYYNPSPGVAIGEESGTKLDRPIHCGFEAGCKASE
tara:strand:+ start:14601 stop:14963 length:363 start_codon:yes stop_codon:yes gene_type:complete